jgi:hypothetical protein
MSAKRCAQQSARPAWNFSSPSWPSFAPRTYWTETHSELTYEADMLALMERNPELGELLLDPAEAEQTRGAT